MAYMGNTPSDQSCPAPTRVFAQVNTGFRSMRRSADPAHDPASPEGPARLPGVLFTKSHNWQRWSGPLTEVTAALNLAMLELQQWSGIPATVKIRISYSNQLTHSSEDPVDLEHLHSA